MDNLLNSTDMAARLGITKQSFGDGVRSGRFTPAGRGKFGHPLFDPAAVAKQYNATRGAAELQDHARQLPPVMRGGRPANNKPRSEENTPTINEDTQKIIKIKAAKELAQTKLADLKFKIQSGLYMEKAEAKRQGVELGEMVMGILRSWPSRLAPELAAMSDKDEHDFLLRLEKEVNTLIISIRQKAGLNEREQDGQRT